MSRKILTVSIAAYNVEAYIRQTLDSVTDERVVDDLEVFVVDDGGTDRTLEIAKEYAAKYPKSIFPIHKDNGGYGSTVNYSIAHATGKYFKLLDGDDWFDRDALFQLIIKLREIESDVVITPHYRVSSATSVRRVDYNVTLWGREVPFATLAERRTDFFAMHSITYRTSVIRQSGLILPEHYFYTDTVYALVPISKCNTAYLLDACVYKYRIGRVGQSMERASAIKHRQDFEKVALVNCEYYEKLKAKNANNLSYIKKRSAATCVGAIGFILISPVNEETFLELKRFDNQLKDTSIEVYSEVERTGKKGKLMKLFRRTGYIPYWLLKLLPGGFPYHLS